MIKLPWPPTVNHYYTVARNRKILSKEGRIYKAAAALMASNQARPTSGPYAIYIVARPPDKRRRDLDNVLKPLLDVLQESGLIADDSEIDALRIVRADPIKDGSVEVRIDGVAK